MFSSVAPADVINSTYLLVFTIVGILTLIGLAIGGTKWLKRQGVRDAQLDKVILLVEGDATHKPLQEQLDGLVRLQDQLTALVKEVTPNGGDTKQLGDTAKRTEATVKDIAEKLDQHIGSSVEIHRTMWRAIRKDTVSA